MAFKNVLVQNAWAFDLRRNIFLPVSEHSHVDLGLDNASTPSQGNAAEELAYSTRPFTVQALSSVARTVCQIGTRCREFVHHCSAGAHCSKLEI